MDRFMNKDFTASDTYGTVTLGRNYAEGVGVTRQTEAIALFVKDGSGWDDYSSMSFDVEVAEALRDHLTAIIEDVKSRKPKEPTRAERWAAAPIGTVITPGGVSTKVEGPFRVKIGPDAWIGPHHIGGPSQEVNFHPDWDIVGTKS